ncbi:MAG: hypothetical protein R3F34_07665 [Planctomycetota bacterium]
MPIRAYENFVESALAVDVGALLKRRLLAGTARLDPDEVRGDGAGAHLSRVVETGRSSTASGRRCSSR